MKFTPFALLAASVACCAAHADSQHTHHGMLDFNVYPYLSDVDSGTVFTVNAASTITDRLSYFGFVDFAGQDTERGDTNGYYSEQTLYWQTADNSGFDVTAQASLASGDDNDKLRLGARWRANDTAFSQAFFDRIHLYYSLNMHMVQLDHSSAYVWQMEHVFNLRMPYLTDRLYLRGFMDHTFNEDLPSEFPDTPIVGEVQLGYQLWGNLYAVAEYRLNQYRRSDVNNFAAGLEYTISW